MDSYMQIINQLVEIKQKIKQENLEEKFERNFNRVFSVIEDEGYIYRYPLGEKYTETHTDCEATIVGRETRNMIVTQVIKPIIYKKNPGGIVLVQKGIVIVES